LQLERDDGGWIDKRLSDSLKGSGKQNPGWVLIHWDYNGF
jgi:hypothetical protein